MSKTVSLRIDDDVYKHLQAHAEAENRSLSNFIETAAMRYMELIDYADEFEMAEIAGNTMLLQRLKQGMDDANNRRGRFA